ncbi:unnamed protein product [Pleuronectes platessa]|uniref:Uncharacterized protein n=1 Tax=Pleuronectes platessa TaxID=8262 RepID=A0A9N7VDV0_PLEPL|nr:unnamed protein product [Pleuronectes platessa]
MSKGCGSGDTCGLKKSHAGGPAGRDLSQDTRWWSEARQSVREREREAACSIHHGSATKNMARVPRDALLPLEIFRGTCFSFTTSIPIRVQAGLSTCTITEMRRVIVPPQAALPPPGGGFDRA